MTDKEKLKAINNLIVADVTMISNYVEDIRQGKQMVNYFSNTLDYFIGVLDTLKRVQSIINSDCEVKE